ncbi:hypothetical protein [Streptosporangium sp. NPDC087985]|uniref:hypothetical protein n=1 Tax=Streptosporangium sp. NPDC087985 TaxID=3366196 RepID=UPI003830B00E
MPHDITITPRAGAQPELVTFGQRYWDLLGVNDDGRISWKEGARSRIPVLAPETKFHGCEQRII